MKIHFTASSIKLLEYKKNYLAIKNEILDLGHTLTRDWIQNAIKKREEGEIVDRETIYEKTMEAVLMADVIIVEGTVPSFSIGHQVTLALSKNKPVLFLLAKNHVEENALKSTFIDGINSPLLTTAEYDHDNVKEIIANFLLKYKDGLHIRFNLVLNNELDNYLDWAIFTYKTNKSEFIRNLISKNMQKDDERYKTYLEKINNRQPKSE